MKTQLAWLLMTAFSVYACQKKPASTDKPETGNAPADTTDQCFAYKNNKDSAALHLQVAGHIATGELSYFLFEKDSNKGEIRGEVHGDTLFARYTFASEGTQSVREVVFLKTGGEWTEGFGDMQEKAGTLVFTDRSKIRFQDGLRFKETSCP
ncbi:hypothetical protein [Dyadobacter sandarakinus]|uniref:NlpE N-terminal domain-containing protein n=1 Tax=Dyadobacter sandarakinus TaxID=2747268 RepID=A0ABX7I7C9_9BACT|nr:hypothetical protein [Dyadobacter sandarakinus]QRR01835.1 hypothetical protein HWI92_13410 [Dyadobacter sandarakinus]